MDATSRLRAIVLLNLAAGDIPHDPAVLREAVLAAFANAGLEAEIQCVSGSELQDAVKHAQLKAREKLAEMIVAGGGDGTVRTVASLLAGTDIPMGIIPLGTFNHFAKDLGLPPDLDGAVQVIADGHQAIVDVAEANGRIFVNNSSIGVYPYMVLDRERRRRRIGVRKWIAMAIAGVRILRLFPVRRLYIQVEGKGEPWRTPCLFVGNNHYGLSLTAARKRERLDAGELWFYIVKQQTRSGVLWFIALSLLGLADTERDLRIFAAPEANIHSRMRRLKVALDGEVIVMRPPLHYRIRPCALRVYAPKAAQG